MLKRLPLCAVFAVLLSLTGCSGGGTLSGTTVIYGVLAALSLALLLVAVRVIGNREPWFLLLFSCVAVVDIGYLLLAVSTAETAALLSNALAYLGSAFLPVAMLMIILNVCRLSYKRWVPVVLIAVASVMFLLAASPCVPALDLYYREVTLESVNGVTVLAKEYGPLHIVYTLYLFTGFAAMIAAIVQATIRKTITSNIYALMLLAAVFVNIGVWLMEKFTDIPFEFLSVSYIISELFMLGLYIMVRQTAAAVVPAPVAPPKPPEEPEEPDPVPPQRLARFEAQLAALTPTEKTVYRLYVEGKGTKEVLAILNIKENTLKYHNRNIYGKLGVSSRKELLMLASKIQ